MPHQAQVVAAAAAGHRTFLLADEPGLGKTAQALLAAQAADAYPLLVVVPNVVKTNWAREADLWTPHRTGHRHPRRRRRRSTASPTSSSSTTRCSTGTSAGSATSASAGWSSTRRTSSRTSPRSARSTSCELSERIRARTARPLLMALTGTPLINDIEDFRAIWQFLGWIDEKKPLRRADGRARGDRPDPGRPRLLPGRPPRVIDLGIVRRRKVDVAADIPARRIADLPVELDDEAGRSIREAERELARRLVARYESALAARTSGGASSTASTTTWSAGSPRWEREDTTHDQDRRERLQP